MEKSPMKKKKWFTAEEKAILHELVRLNSSVINTGRRKGVSVQAKKKAWQNITDIYNDHPRTITTRTVIELRRCWDCMKFYAKKRSENLAEFGDGDVSNISQQVADCKNVATATHIQSQPPLQCLGLHQHILASILANDDASQQPASILTSSAAVSEDHIHQQLQTSAEQDEKQITGGVISAAKDDGAISKDEVTCSVKPVDPATASIGSDVSTTTASQSDQVSANNSSDSNSESNTALLKSLQQLQRSNQLLRSQVISAEMQLVQQQQKQLHLEHIERMRRQQEEHEARLSALRQDLALKKIMFRVHACALQSEE